MINIKLNNREKGLFVVAVLIFIGMGINMGIDFYNEKIGNIFEERESQEIILQKQQELLADIGIKSRLENAKNQLSIINNRLIEGNNPNVALAKLQKILFETAGSLSIKIDSTSPKESEDLEIYIKVPIEISFKAPLDRLKEMLLKVESSETMMTISDIKLNTDENRLSKDILVTMVISGYIKKESI